MGMEAPERITLYTHVVLEMNEAGETQRLEFDLVSAQEADYYAGFLGENTPLGKAILGQAAGSQVAYENDGEMIRVRILQATPSTRRPQPGRERKRQETIRQAVRDSQLKDRLSVATSMGNKWGDLDADGFARSLEDERPIDE
jgi:hypothetical protein